ncbi:hypothetical protein [Streptomyces sp. NPDC002588]|uniref:MoaF-related domain-containing protein n=1 Tax=Streptomyces sp. NPDC002588 TaxID=3154419 RepID=UPI00331BDC68
MTFDTGATIPGVGQTWLAEFEDTPFGPFAVELTFHSGTSLSYLVSSGAAKGNGETMDYTTAELRDGLYVLCWEEPESGAKVTHIQDWQNHLVYASSFLQGQFMQISGTWTRLC